MGGVIWGVGAGLVVAGQVTRKVLQGDCRKVYIESNMLSLR
jgi:hypothetical protein